MKCCRCSGLLIKLAYSENYAIWYNCLKCVNCSAYFWESVYEISSRVQEVSRESYSDRK